MRTSENQRTRTAARSSVTRVVLIDQPARPTQAARPASPPRPTPSHHPTAAKRAFDVVAALLLTLLLAPLLILIALVVKLSSRGPVLFSQRRVGHEGREFLIRKFRTMQTGAEDWLVGEPDLLQVYIDQDHKLPVRLDPRVTRVGRWLRKTSLDELPQLVNVLMGEMSIVGPRPVRPCELSCYGDLLPAYLSLRPGLTGLWQVSGRSEVKFPRRAELDAEYAHTWSPRVDLRILILTPGAVARGRGAQ